MGVKFGMEEGTFGPLLHAKFHSHRCNVSPLRGEKPQNRPLSKRNTGRFALRAMLPVNMRPVDDFPWLGSVLRVPFSALAVLLGQQEGHPVCKIPAAGKCLSKQMEKEIKEATI